MRLNSLQMGEDSNITHKSFRRSGPRVHSSSAQRVIELMSDVATVIRGVYSFSRGARHRGSPTLLKHNVIE